MIPKEVSMREGCQVGIHGRKLATNSPEGQVQRPLERMVRLRKPNQNPKSQRFGMLRSI